MNRVVAREIAVQILFGAEMVSIPVRDYASDFLDKERFLLLKGESEIYNEPPDKNCVEYIYSVIDNYATHKEEIDKLISDNSNGWKLNRISSTALSVMRVAVCEMLYMDDIPTPVAINSAVELDKGYDDADVVSFVNGVLGSIAKVI